MNREYPSRNTEDFMQAPYDLLYGNINLKEEIGEMGIRLLVPGGYLFGRQKPEEYSNRKRKQIERIYKDRGPDYLRENPVIVCSLFQGNNLYLVIVDGHHRVRYAPLHNIGEIPCLISTPQHLAGILNKYNQNQVDATTLAKQFFIDASVAISIITERYPRFHPPTPMVGVRDLDQLRERLRSF